MMSAERRKETAMQVPQIKRAVPARHIAAIGLKACRHAERPAVALVTFCDVLRSETLLVAAGCGLIAVLVVEVAADIVTVAYRKEHDE
jgi:hypothetical protein